MSPTVVMIAEFLVAILLVTTIMTCSMLAKRISKLKADEEMMRKTITDLVMATENAQRAIAGLRTTLSDCDRTLGERLRTAERYASDLAAQVEAGEAVMQRIAKIVDASRLVAPQSAEAAMARETVRGEAEAGVVAPASAAEAKLSKTAAIAQSLMQRAVRRLEGQPA